jgi:hypothetical protein
VQYTENHILLPNLISITFSDAGGFQLAWILPFLSPSLLRLEFIILTPQFTPSSSMFVSYVLLRPLSEKCPTLQRLTILPKQRDLFTSPEDRKIIIFLGLSEDTEEADLGDCQYQNVLKLTRQVVNQSFYNSC